VSALKPSMTTPAAAGAGCLSVLWPHQRASLAKKSAAAAILISSDYV